MMRQVVTRWIAVANDGERHCIHYADGWHLTYKEKGNVK